MTTQNYTINYEVTLTNNSMPFADDATYDVKDVMYSKEVFADEKAAKKYFKAKVKELNLMKAGRGTNLYANSQFELYLCAKHVA